MKYRNLPMKMDTTSQIAESTLANILRPFTLYSVCGRIFFNSGICFKEYKMPLTRYVFRKEKEIRNVLNMVFLP